MEEDYEEEDEKNLISWWTALGIGIAIGALIFGKTSKFDGMTAEEWYNDYDYTVACLQEIQENADTYSGGTYKEMNDALDEISSKVDDCI